MAMYLHNIRAFCTYKAKPREDQVLHNIDDKLGHNHQPPVPKGKSRGCWSCDLVYSSSSSSPTTAETSTPA
jgi:hypothetical protein